MTHTCYAIVSGEYSEYRIHAIYTSSRLAEITLPYYEKVVCMARIQELPLDPPEPPMGMQGYYCWEGKCNQIGAYKVTPDDVMSNGQGAELTDSVKKRYKVYVWAADKDHAIKIAAEKIAHQRAIDCGISL